MILSEDGQRIISCSDDKTVRIWSVERMKETLCLRASRVDEVLGGDRMAKPLAKFRAGQVSAAIWENEITASGKTMPMLKATVQRRYKDRDGTWKSSSSFSRNEIPLAIYCLNKCFEHMIEGQKDDENDGVEEEAVM